MNKYIFTFGSNHLPTLNNILRPMQIMLIVTSNNESTARKKVFDSFVGDKFATSYDYSEAQQFKDDYKMFEVEFDDLINLEETRQLKNDIIHLESQAINRVFKNKGS